MGMNYPHNDDWVEGKVHFEPLRILVSELDESIEGQSLFVSLFGCEHGFVDIEFLLFSELRLSISIITSSFFPHSRR